MCGIIGVVGPAASTTDLGPFVSKLKHRGPNGKGMFQGPGFSVGHTLLSLQGDRPTLQPLTSSSGAFFCYNGEVYNFQSLSQTNFGDNPAVHNCDSHVVFDLLSKVGPPAFQDFNGMYALGLVSSAGDLLLARDPLGIKPLYYAQANGSLYFGSEAGVVSDLAFNSREYDEVALSQYAMFRYPFAPRSYFKRVSALSPGHMLRFSPSIGEAKLETFDYQVTTHPSAPLEQVLPSAVKRQMVSSHSVSVFLSGGLDSSLIAAIAALEAPGIDTYSVGIEGSKSDESNFAQLVASHIGSNHHLLRLDEEDYKSEHQDLIMKYGEPIGVPNQVAIALLSKQIRQDNRCVLSGEGADELFAGYGRIFRLFGDFDRYQQWRRGDTSLETFGRKFRKRYGDVDTFENVFLQRYSYISPSSATDLLGMYLGPKESLNAVEQAIAEFRNTLSISNSNDVTKWFLKNHLQGLLARLDLATMSTSLEARVPFLDHEVVGWASQLTFNQKLAELSDQAQEALGDDVSEKYDIPKKPLKDLAEAYLPREIVYRPKIGFPIPSKFYTDTERDEVSYDQWITTNLSFLLS